MGRVSSFIISSCEGATFVCLTRRAVVAVRGTRLLGAQKMMEALVECQGHLRRMLVTAEWRGFVA